MSKDKDKDYSKLEPKVTGIGGLFFYTEDPKESRKWYAKHLGLAVSSYGSSFEFRNANNPNEINYLQWSPFQKGDQYFNRHYSRF